MKHSFSLNGSWEFSQIQSGNWQPATVPGCVHTDLLAVGEIADPYYRDNELSLLWIGETDWLYRKRFTLPADYLKHPQIGLCCHGLDTLADITLNGQRVGQTDNQFRTWTFEVKNWLQPGENELIIHFKSALRYGQAKLAERYIHSWSTDTHKLPGGNYVRKSQCNFGWDWGPRLVTCGVWRDIELVAVDVAHLDDVCVKQVHPTADRASCVTLIIDIAATIIQETDLSADVSISLDGEEVISATVSLAEGYGQVELDIDHPHLWWPHGLGSQPLYRIDVALVAHDQIIDRRCKRVGLRQLQLIRELDEWGESFYFQCNGVPFFAKGANWIPADSLVTRVSKEQYVALLRSAVAANMNMLRVWGGGIYEPDYFYDLCDELGICIWQDFMFACATYPSFDPDFMANVAQEAREQIQRLRHHACLALWCGNNELEQGLVDDTWTERAMSWQDYGRLFDHLLPQLVTELDPHTNYWPGSPHSPYGNRLEWNNPHWGDAHIWDVWHGMQPFEFYRTCWHRFNSEFGFQSLPEPATLNAVLADEDKNMTSFVMEHHQRSPSGNSKIMTYMLDWFQLPSSFDNTIWLSQILQGMAVKYAVEHWRRTMPRGMGTLYWQLNDSWPVASWSSVDSLGRWKALHYMARHFFAPTLLSAVEDVTAGTLAIHVSHDPPQPLTGLITWDIMTASDGTILQRGSHTCQIQGPTSTVVTVVDLATELAVHGQRNILVHLQLEGADKVMAHNLVHLSRPKHLKLARPTIRSTVEKEGDVATIRLTTDRPALWTWLALDGSAHHFSDNFFHLFPHRDVHLTFKTTHTVAALQQQLVISSLWHTF